MGAIADLSDLINRATGGNSGTPDNLWFYKSDRIGGVLQSMVASQLHSSWRFDGFPAGGAAPGAPAIPTNATAGSLLQADAGGGREKWLYSVFANYMVANTAFGMFIVYDRLLHQSNLSGAVATAQTVQGTGTPTPPLTRSTGGIGNIAFVEIYTTIGTTATTITMTYTNEDGDTSTSPARTIGGTGFREATRCIMLPLAEGDRGIRAVQTVTLAATTGAAGAFGITIAKPIAVVDVRGAAGGMRDFTQGLPGIPKIDSGACLSFLTQTGQTVACEIIGSLSTIEA